jgi:hypothetical protein
MTDARLLRSIRAATDVMRRAAIDLCLERAMDRFQRLLREHALDRRYNPDWRLQPRLPRGDPDGGQWTRGPGGVGGEGDRTVPSDSGTRDGQRPARRLAPGRPASRGPVGLTDRRVISDADPDNDWELGEQYAQRPPTPPRSTGGSRRIADRVFINGRQFNLNPQQATQLDLLIMQRDFEVARVREIEPNWRARESAVESFDGLIDAIRSETNEADARFTELQNAGVCPGPYATESIPARSSGRDFRVGERLDINTIGSVTGCHTCGTKVPGTGSGNFIPDHQPPTAFNPLGRPQRLFPHCATCSARQGNWLLHNLER